MNTDKITSNIPEYSIFKDNDPVKIIEGENNGDGWQFSFECNETLPPIFTECDYNKEEDDPKPAPTKKRCTRTKKKYVYNPEKARKYREKYKSEKTEYKQLKDKNRQITEENKLLRQEISELLTIITYKDDKINELKESNEILLKAIRDSSKMIHEKNESKQSTTLCPCPLCSFGL